MKKYFFEVSRLQLEKPTEPQYIFVTTAKNYVIADSEEEAYALSKAKFEADYHGRGLKLGEIRLTKTAELPIDWSYGYGDDRKSGSIDSPAELLKNAVIR